MCSETSNWERKRQRNGGRGAAGSRGGESSGQSSRAIAARCAAEQSEEEGWEGGGMGGDRDDTSGGGKPLRWGSAVREGETTHRQGFSSGVLQPHSPTEGVCVEGQSICGDWKGGGEGSELTG